MAGKLQVKIDAFDNGAVIPDKYAFCIPDKASHAALGQNLSPAIRWSGAPPGTASYAIICSDPDVPTVLEDVNSEARTIPVDQPRMTFYHWVLVDIPADRDQLEEGVESSGIQPGGKDPGRTDHGVRGINNYTDWFAGDDQMKGNYGGYDGPCPPWNDLRLHHYHFRLYALDVKSLGLKGNFTGAEAEAALKPHILAEAEWVGTYTLNPDLRRG